MNLETDRDARSGTPSQNFSVLRVKRDVLARSSVGAVVTNVQGGGSFNRVVGADAAFYFGRPWQIEGWAAMVDQTGGGGAGGYGRVGYETDRHGYGYTFLGLDERFAPGVGFVLRCDEFLGDEIHAVAQRRH